MFILRFEYFAMKIFTLVNFWENISMLEKGHSNLVYLKYNLKTLCWNNN